VIAKPASQLRLEAKQASQLRLEQHQPKGRLGIPYEKHFAVGNRITVQLRAILVCSV